MTDQESSNPSNPPATQPQPNWIVRRVQKIKRYFHQRRATKKQENPQDRASRRTANATVAIAALTLAVVLIGGLQYLIFKAQLKVMADQLVEMQGTGKQTDDLIEANKKLADAATKSAVIADKTLKISQRAYFSFSPKLTGYEKGGRPTIALTVRNVGTTPAYDATMKTSIAVAQYPLPSAIVLPDENVPTSATVMTREELITGTVKMRDPIPDNRFDAIDQGTDARLIVWGILDFKDAFGCKIKRTVCYFYSGEQARTNNPEVCGDGKNSEKYVGECPQ